MDLYKGVPHNSVHYRKKLESTKFSTIENRELKCHRCILGNTTEQREAQTDL